MRDSEKTSKNCVLAAIFYFLFSYVAQAAPLAVLQPLDCNTNKYLTGVEKYKGHSGEKECVENEPAACNELPENEIKKGQGRSICKNIYLTITNTLNEYEAILSQRCQTSNDELRVCIAKPVGDAIQNECMRDHANVVSAYHLELDRLMLGVQEGLNHLLVRATEARSRYRKEKKKSKLQGPTPSGRPMAAALMDSKCLVGSRTVRDPMALLRPVPGDSESEGKIIDEQTTAIKLAQSFRIEAIRASEEHQKKARAFKAHAVSMDDLAKRARSVDSAAATKAADEKKKSDITGGEKKEAAAQPKGGDSKGGESPARGATAATPGSANNSTAPLVGVAKDSETKNNLKNLGGTGTAESFAKLIPPSKAESVRGGFAVGGSRVSSRAPSDGRGGSGTRPASSKAAGGGSLGASGGTADCLGVDCQQALGNLKSSQFASTGSLGASGGLGADGGSGSLDSLFNSADAALAGGASPGALASLDASLDPGVGGGAESVQAGGEIGELNDRDLFFRVHKYYISALKRGFLHGVPKKL